LAFFTQKSLMSSGVTTYGSRLKIYRIKIKREDLRQFYLKILFAILV